MQETSSAISNPTKREPPGLIVWAKTFGIFYKRFYIVINMISVMIIAGILMVICPPLVIIPFCIVAIIGIFIGLYAEVIAPILHTIRDIRNEVRDEYK